MFNTIMGINEAKTLKKDISCGCKCKFDGRKCKSNQCMNNDKCQCECKIRHICDSLLECKMCHICENDYVRNPATCGCENGKCLASIMDDSSIMYDEVIESNKNYFD